MILCEEEAEIRKFMRETRDRGERRRGEAVLLCMKGVSYRVAAKMVGVHYVTVYRWVKRYEREGVIGLRRKIRRGKKSLTPEQRRLIAQAVVCSPRGLL